MKFLEIMKETRLYIVLGLTIGGTSVIHWEQSMKYFFDYNAHLGIITILGMYINHLLSAKRHRVSERRMDKYSEIHTNLQEQIKDIVIEGSRRQLKAEVRQAFKDFHNIEKITTITTIKYLRALDDRRKFLKINTYTEDMMRVVLEKIKII